MVSNITKVNMAARNEEHLILTYIAEKVQLNIENYTNMSKRIENLEPIVTGLFSSKESLLLYDPSCLYLINMGKYIVVHIN